MSPSELRVAVVGGGIGGLTLAIALQRLGVEVEVFEQSPELAEIGAAVALSANGTRLLRSLGVEEALTRVAEVSELQFRSWDDGELIWSHPVGEWYRERCGAPYYGVHRAALQKALFESLAPGIVHLGHRVVDVVEEADGARLIFESDTTSADVVVGADGAGSTVRRRVAGKELTPVFSGDIGFRGLIPVEKLPTLPDTMALQFWVGPERHLLHYPIDGGKLVIFLAVVSYPKQWTDSASKVEAEVQEAVDAFRGWHPAVTEMIGAVEDDEDPAWWALTDLPPLERWSAGRLVLMGDGAHHMLPHQGQGANTTIEDAVALAHFLAEARHDDFRQAFGRYEALRMRRTRRVQRYSRFAQRALHVPDGPEAERRNAGLSTTAEDIAWMHEYDVREDLAVTNTRYGRARNVD